MYGDKTIIPEETIYEHTECGSFRQFPDITDSCVTPSSFNGSIRTEYGKQIIPGIDKGEERKESSQDNKQYQIYEETKPYPIPNSYNSACGTFKSPCNWSIATTPSPGIIENLPYNQWTVKPEYIAEKRQLTAKELFKVKFKKILKNL